jgi:hypothetical protein
MSQNGEYNDGTGGIRVGRVIMDAGLLGAEVEAVAHSIEENTPFETERQTGMRIDVFRPQESDTNRNGGKQ